MKFKCFNCNKVFSDKEMKYEDVPSNFSVFGHSGNKVEQCPHCEAVAFVGFTRIE